MSGWISWTRSQLESSQPNHNRSLLNLKKRSLFSFYPSLLRDCCSSCTLYMLLLNHHQLTSYRFERFSDDFLYFILIRLCHVVWLISLFVEMTSYACKQEYFLWRYSSFICSKRAQIFTSLVLYVKRYLTSVCTEAL